MYQLLLVDDEEATLQGLASLNWKQIDIEAVHCARSVKKALEMIEAHPIDVVVSDIRMPGRTGVDLLEDIEKSSYEPKCILLSGYSDFSYAQAAIKAQAVDYLLKPVRDEDLIRSVSNALRRRIEERKERYIKNRSIEAVKQNIDPFIESIFIPWLKGDKENEALRAELQAYDIPSENNVNVIYLKMEGIHDKKEQVVTLVTTFLSEKAILIRQHSSPEALVMMLYPLHLDDVPQFETIMHERVFQLKKELKKKLQQAVRVDVGEMLSFWKEAQLAFQDYIIVTVDKPQVGQEQLANRVREYVKAHFNQHPNLQDVATYLYLNPAYVSKRFKEETGETFTDYMHRLRMNHAIKLLADTNMKISHVSKELGYQNPSYFIRVFKKEFKRTPHEFRKQ